MAEVTEILQGKNNIRIPAEKCHVVMRDGAANAIAMTEILNLENESCLSHQSQVYTLHIDQPTNQTNHSVSQAKVLINKNLFSIGD
ncbi:MAG: hypothetical protein GY821_16300 [Gammaproteobacteria bacterium]|nr:hypothetical protein [Gammaproteobacteria bacterium]